MNLQKFEGFILSDLKTPNTQTSYDRVAEEYAKQFNDELKHKPRDRELLEQFAAWVQGKGRVVDIGCGPGHVARYLYEHGVEAATGLDLSSNMIEQARKLHPMLTFYAADMRKLPFDDGELAAITAFYSIIHIPRTEVTDVLREWKRALQPDGLVLLAFHVGDQVVHLDEWWEQTVSLDFAFFTSDEMRGYLETAGFVIDVAYERPPYPTEHPSTRAYITAWKPA